MELLSLVTMSTDHSPLLSTSTHLGQRKTPRRALEDVSDLRQRTAVMRDSGQLTGRRLVDQGIAHLLPSEISYLLQSGMDYARASDEQLIAAAKSSDTRAFDELSGRHLGPVRKVVYHIVRNREDAEDVVQDSLLKAYCRLSGFREACAFSTWLTQIAINTARMLLRKRRARSELSLVQSGQTDQTERILESPDLSPGIEQTYCRQEALSFMSRAVNRLPEVYRSIVEQYHAQEKSMQEAADSLGISVASAKSRLYRARRILRSRLEGRRLSIVDAEL